MQKKKSKRLKSLQITFTFLPDTQEVFSVGQRWLKVIQQENEAVIVIFDFNVSKINRSKKKSQLINEEKQANDDFILFNNLHYPSNQVHCDCCEKDITQLTKIYCPDSQTDICVNCFADGNEFNDHQMTEDYYAINKLNFPLFSEDWTAEEELLLFEGLERFGFGNWQEIAQLIGGDKSKEEVEKHYDEFYLSQDGKAFLPQDYTVFSQRDEKTLELTFKQSKQMEDENSSKNQKKTGKSAERKDITSLPTPGSSRMTTIPTATNIPNSNNNNASEIVGFMPKRGDFDIQYDNDAELLLAEMEFNEDDQESDQQMKFKLLDIYNARLDERLKRQKFVIERNLLDLQKQNNLDKQRTKEEKEIYNMMQVFTRFNTPEDHQKLVQGIIKEKQIRQRIEELKNYRKMGLKNFQDVENFLQEKKKKDEQYIQKQKQNDSYIFDSKTSFPSSSSRNTPRRTRSINMVIDPKANMGSEKQQQIPPNMNEKEIELCDNLGLSPYEYLVIQQVLVREAVKQNFITKSSAQNLLKLDKERVTGIFDFLVTHNYILDKEK